MNKQLAKVLAKILKIKPMSVSFVYEKESYDKDITKLGFLNQVKGEFNELSEEFKEQLDEEIRKATSNRPS